MKPTMNFDFLSPILGTLSQVHIRLVTALRGSAIGQDEFGNRYFRSAPRRGEKQERRWVLYAHRVDASEVPPEWHAWLHHQSDDVPGAHSAFRRRWQKPYVPNMTGTAGAYLPPGHQLAAAHRAKATGDYQAWRPV